MDKHIVCYKCGRKLGVIRDALLYNDMYYVCGACLRPKQSEHSDVRISANDLPDFFSTLFNMNSKRNE